MSEQINKIELIETEEPENEKEVELGEREEPKNEKEIELSKREAVVNEKETELIELEKRLNDGEIKQQNKAMQLDDLEAKLFNLQQDFYKRSAVLDDREKLLFEREKSINEEIVDIGKKSKSQAESFDSIRIELAKQASDISDREHKLQSDRNALQQQIIDVQKRERALKYQLCASFNEERSKFLADISKKESQTSEKYNELIKDKATFQAKLTIHNNEMLRKAFEVKQNEIDKEGEANTEQRQQNELDKAVLETEKKNFEKQKKNLLERKSRLDDEVRERARLEANKLCEQIKDELALKERTLSLVNENAHRHAQRADEIEQSLIEIQRTCGESPQEIKIKLNRLQERNKELEEKLANIPTDKLEKLDILEQENGKLKAKIGGLNESIEELRKEREDLLREASVKLDLEAKIYSKDNELESNKRKLESSEKAQEELKRQLDIATGNFGSPTWEQRVAQIQSPLIQFSKPQNRRAFDKSQPSQEKEWLDGIALNLKNAGFEFSNRMLKSFHTSLKIAEYSPLTVLAGVSGVGKSKLPELYAKFGGINFLMESVLPTWDSPQSMLGFFDVINCCYKPQPILKLLAQSASKYSLDNKNGSETGFEDVMSIILLDEMNLAHVELYFAGFLSKLEERRGKHPTKFPHIDIDLGSNLEPYPIKLGRNILWIGTMNQDETTKALSDKVLDRGNVITSPRPKKLVSSNSLATLQKSLSTDVPLMTKAEWSSWINLLEVPESLKTNVDKYHKAVEEINDLLDGVGRTIGHRVWQSIERYIINYPDVLETIGKYEVMSVDESVNKKRLDKAMRVAFEDCVVQKIMPKLRGVSKRGDALDKTLIPIQNKLEELELSIVEDYKRAVESGNNFNWVSSNYLLDEVNEDLHISNDAFEIQNKDE